LLITLPPIVDYIGAMTRDSAMAGLDFRDEGDANYDDDQDDEKAASSLGIVTPRVVVRRLVDIIDRVKKKAPRATVFLVDYINVLGDVTEPGSPGCPLSAKRIAHHRARGEALAKAFREAAAARPNHTVLVRVSDLSRGHEVGGEEPWVTGFSVAMLMGPEVMLGQVAYHPNAKAHVAMAEELYKVISEWASGRG
jgi:hypothetical protein